MQIKVSFEIPCSPHAAWRALHDPQIAAQLYGPLLHMVPLSTLPTTWQPGDSAKVALKAFGLLPMGTQSIVISDHVGRMYDQEFLVMQDSGEPLTGPLTLLTTWNHQLAVGHAPANPHNTQWHERLVIGGPLAPAFYPVLWTIWQLRSARLRKLARNW